MAKSYLRIGGRNPFTILNDLHVTYRVQSANLARDVAAVIATTGQDTATIEGLLGAPLQGRDILEIGSGPKPTALHVLARTNRCIGIDIEKPPERLTLREAARIWRENGALRLVKTTARHALGLQARYIAEVSRQLGVPVAELKLDIRVADAAAMPFAQASFDVVYSKSVFEHLPDLPAVIREARRVLRPGGVACIFTHLYTSHTGPHDPRLFEDPAALPPWSHLRPGLSDRVRPNAYVNKLRLDDYRRLFAADWPGCDFRLLTAAQPSAQDLAALRAAGELAGYRDEELLASVLVTTWKKPPDGGAGAA